MKDFMILNPNDDVAVALHDIEPGIEFHGMIVKENIPAGHKVALKDIDTGCPVLKYGYVIGTAATFIPSGSHVHTHNIRTSLSEERSYTYEPHRKPLPAQKPAEFMGYVRPDGRIGIRNEIWIINTVGCVNQTAELLCSRANLLFPDRTDGFYTFHHPYGCSQLGDDHESTRRILADLVHHPNAGGVLVLSLGCENNTPASFRELIGEYDPERVLFLTAQEVEDEVEAGLTLLDILSQRLSYDVREPVRADQLVIGLKCGGSDGFSGITANPLIGRISDQLLAMGGTSVLTEVPEMFGAETILMNRAQDQETFEKIVALINDFKDYFLHHGQVVYENPSPGNKAGGITTLEDKSLGCTQKGGQGIVTDVLRYGDRVKIKGLNLLEGPGNDLVAETALTAAGCHMILFSTGRGTPVGAPVPTIKIASNTPLSQKKKHWIDFDAGILLEKPDLHSAADALMDQILRVASGEKTKNEKYGYREIAIWKDGVTL